MKNKLWFKCISIMAALIVLSFQCSCNSNEKIKYYSQKDNYINVTGTLSKIGYNEESTALYLEFSETSYVFDDICFKLVGNNLQITQANEIDYSLKVGDKVEFITAPKYFGDGYVMPIVAISANGKIFLEFEEGYDNLIDWLSE